MHGYSSHRREQEAHHMMVHSDDASWRVGRALARFIRAFLALLSSVRRCMAGLCC